MQSSRPGSCDSSAALRTLQTAEYHINLHQTEEQILKGSLEFGFLFDWKRSYPSSLCKKFQNMGVGMPNGRGGHFILRYTFRAFFRSFLPPFSYFRAFFSGFFLFLEPFFFSARPAGSLLSDNPLKY